MKKQFLVGLVVFLFVFGFGASALTNALDNTSVSSWNTMPCSSVNNKGDDVLDQYQNFSNWGFSVGVYPATAPLNCLAAQSFTPTKPVLTRVELDIGKNRTTTYDFTVVIRDNLKGVDLTMVSVPSAEIVTENFSWVVFDFPDIVVTPGSVYYMVAFTENATDNWYGWSAYHPDNYPNGTCFVSTNDGKTWTEDTVNDMTFKTYGADATELAIEITGGVGFYVTVRNIGEIEAVDVTASATVTGGFLSRVNTSDSTEMPVLFSNASLVLRGLPLGLGPVTIVVSAQASNAALVTKTVAGWMIVFFILLS